MISSNRRRVTPLCAVVGVAAAQIMALFCVLLFPLGSSSQQPSDQKAKQAPSGMGVATGAAHPAIKDSHSRPITAGGFVDGAPVYSAISQNKRALINSCIALEAR